MNIQSALNWLAKADINIQDDSLIRRKVALTRFILFLALIIAVTVMFHLYVYSATPYRAIPYLIVLIVLIIPFYQLIIKKDIDSVAKSVLWVLFGAFNLVAFLAHNHQFHFPHIFYPVFPVICVIMLGIRLSILPVIVSSAILLLHCYFGIGEWLNGEWGFSDFLRFVAFFLALTFIAYYNEWTITESISRVKALRENERIIAAEHTQNIEAMLDKKKQLLMDVSHELRTPLSVLKLHLEALDKGIGEKQAHITTMHNKVEQVSRLMSDIYLLSKGDIDQLPMQCEIFPLRVLIEDINCSFQPQAEEKSISLEIHQNIGEDICIDADWERIQQVMGNLLKNSLAYTDSGGCIKIYTRKLGSYVEIIVEDSSPGVSNDNLLKLTDRLFRVESSRNRASGGSGLGLAICEIIIEAHQGTMTLHHSELGGIKVLIKLPQAILDEEYM